MKTFRFRFGIFLLQVMFAVSVFAHAEGYIGGYGQTDYTLGVDELAESVSVMTGYIILTEQLLCAFAGVFCVVSALQIYIKMNTHEGDVRKDIMRLFFAMIFMGASYILINGFFGYEVYEYRF